MNKRAIAAFVALSIAIAGLCGGINVGDSPKSTTQSARKE